MSLNIEEFAKRLSKEISAQHSRNGYVLAGNLTAAIEKALVPENQQDQQFPAMMYHGGMGCGPNPYCPRF